MHRVKCRLKRLDDRAALWCETSNVYHVSDSPTQLRIQRGHRRLTKDPTFRFQEGTKSHVST